MSVMKKLSQFYNRYGKYSCVENNYLLLLKYRKGTVDVVAGKFKFFFKNTKDDYF